MNVYEFAEEFRLSLKKARAMEKRGLLRLDGGADSEGDAIRHLLSRGQPLTAAMLCTLLESPGLVLELGKYASRAQEQISALGNAKGQAAPKHVAAYISDAARGDAEALGVLSDWLREVIPARPVDHCYIAVRLLLGLAPNARKFDIPRIPRALLNIRKRPDFAAWFTIETRGDRGKTFYNRPAKKPVATFDL